jgi:hypothetical protein
MILLNIKNLIKTSITWKLSKKSLITYKNKYCQIYLILMKQLKNLRSERFRTVLQRMMIKQDIVYRNLTDILMYYLKLVYQLNFNNRWDKVLEEKAIYQEILLLEVKNQYSIQNNLIKRDSTLLWIN